EPFGKFDGNSIEETSSQHICEMDVDGSEGAENDEVCSGSDEDDSEGDEDDNNLY
ncbi:unnamed protein product, partial [Didymodactylos carnosus]